MLLNYFSWQLASTASNKRTIVSTLKNTQLRDTERKVLDKVLIYVLKKSKQWLQLENKENILFVTNVMNHDVSNMK